MPGFRDRLRVRPDEWHLYERTRRKLAAGHWDYVQDYADAKSTVVEEIISRTGQVRVLVDRVAC